MRWCRQQCPVSAEVINATDVLLPYEPPGVLPLDGSPGVCNAYLPHKINGGLVTDERHFPHQVERRLTAAGMRSSWCFYCSVFTDKTSIVWCGKGNKCLGVLLDRQRHAGPLHLGAQLPGAQRLCCRARRPAAVRRRGGRGPAHLGQGGPLILCRVCTPAHVMWARDLAYGMHPQPLCDMPAAVLLHLHDLTMLGDAGIELVLVASRGGPRSWNVWRLTPGLASVSCSTS